MKTIQLAGPFNNGALSATKKDIIPNLPTVKQRKGQNPPKNQKRKIVDTKYV